MKVTYGLGILPTEKELCGVAVAWKVVILLDERLGISNEEAFEFIENAAFATVGDVMPLTGENRIIVKEGLKRIHNTKNIGMKALILQCGLEPENVESYHFGFVLGPCINATGRLDTARRALKLLCSGSEGEAALIASGLVALNDERKEMTRQGYELAISTNVKHWHGAKKNSWFSHIAVEVPGEDCTNEWCEPVSNAEYDVLENAI